MPEFIASHQNSKIKQIRQLLSNAAYRKKTGLSVIESPKIVTEILQQVPESLIFGIQAESAHFPYHPLFSKVSDTLFQSLSDLPAPQGVLGVIQTPDFLPAIPYCPKWALALDGVSDARNLGAILRSAKAFECPLILLSDKCANPFHPDALRAAATVTLTLPMARLTRDSYAQMIEFGLTPMALTPNGTPIESMPLKTCRPLVIMGSEAHGIQSDFLLSDTIQTYRIPMSPKVESLNVSVATGIVLYILRAQISPED